MTKSLRHENPYIFWECSSILHLPPTEGRRSKEDNHKGLRSVEGQDASRVAAQGNAELVAKRTAVIDAHHLEDALRHCQVTEVDLATAFAQGKRQTDAERPASVHWTASHRGINGQHRSLVLVGPRNRLFMPRLVF